MYTSPDLQWCTERSNENGVNVRCPFATVDSCPRYYQSLSLLGKAGSTEIAKDEDKKLLAKWKKSDLWPRTGEYATSVSGPVGNPRHFANFCPEVAFDRFGYFATQLSGYVDEIDVGIVHRRLAKESALPNDSRWAWDSITAQHYTECPIYSVLIYRAKTSKDSVAQAELPWWRKHLVELIVGLLVTVVGGLLLKLFGSG